MDILEELPVEQWPILQEKLKKMWPLNLPGYYTLHANLKYPALRDATSFNVYCPYGDMDNGFVGIYAKYKYPNIIMFSITEDTSKIEEALLKTKLINWNGVLIFNLVTSLILQTLERVKTAMKFQEFHVAMAKMYYLEGTKPVRNLCLPDKTYLTTVKPEHVRRVDDAWPHKHPNSNVTFRDLVSLGLSYGLYSSETDELLAWIFISKNNYLTHFYCEDKYRRRGYGEFVMQCAVNDLLKDGHDVYAYVVPGNEKPITIFSRLGFKAGQDTAFVFIKNN